MTHDIYRRTRAHTRARAHTHLSPNGSRLSAMQIARMESADTNTGLAPSAATCTYTQLKVGTSVRQLGRLLLLASHPMNEHTYIHSLTPSCTCSPKHTLATSHPSMNKSLRTVVLVRAITNLDQHWVQTAHEDDLQHSQH